MTALVLLSSSSSSFAHCRCASEEEHRTECYDDVSVPNDPGAARSTSIDAQRGTHDDDMDDDASFRPPFGVEEADIPTTASPNGVMAALLQLKTAPPSSEAPLASVVEEATEEDGMDGALDELFAADDDEESFVPAEQPTEGERAERFATPYSSPLRNSSTSTALALWPLSPTWSPRSESPPPFAGLDNLGNTCYLASALQLLASLPSFTEALRQKQVANGSNTALRKAYLDVMEQLQQSQQQGSVSPEAFKEALDERTSLFLGYRQQDSHEFLTTLLDLLDEDYKIKPVAMLEDEDTKGESVNVLPSEEPEPEHSSGHSMDRSFCAKKQKTEESIVQDMDMEDSTLVLLPSSQPVGDDPLDDESSSSSYRSSVQSLSELDVNAIDRLLHGSSNADDVFAPEVSPSCFSSHRRKGGVEDLLESEQPHYKLIGGRMNMTDVVLSPYASGLEPEDGNLSSSTRRMSHAAEHATTSRVVEDDHADPMDASNDDNDGPSESVVSPIDAMFTTEVRVRLTCDSCKLSRTHKETFLHLSLEIGANNELCAGSIEDSLRRFFAPCTQEVKCEKCFCETATQCFEITKLPPALLLHLKRFIVDYNGDWSSVTYRKNQADVHLNEALAVDEEGTVLSEFLSSDCTVASPSNVIPDEAMPCCTPRKYVLRSVVSHIGSSANCGHYTADAQRAGKASWWRFNDSYVSALSVDEVIEQSKQTAYMCLYELK